MALSRRSFLVGFTLTSACAIQPAPPASAVGSASTVTPDASPSSASSTAADLAAIAPPELRLPKVARPVRYDLELWLDPSSPDFRGRIIVELEILERTPVLWLNATDLVVDAATIDPGGPVRVVASREGFVGFALGGGFSPGRARLRLDYHGTIDQTRSRGIYAAREGDGTPYLYSFFEPVDARRAFPCFDEPAYKVPWKVSLHVPKNDVALGNTAVSAERPEDESTKLVELAESKPLPSYLVAFIVGPFDVVDAGKAGHADTPLRMVVPRGRGAETAYAARVTPRIVGALEDYFGMLYPYGKLDVAVVPRYWGTMEHPGLVALGQPLTLIAPAEETVRREQDYASIAAHELGHYWFGDYVTTAWWDDTWLNEGMTEWLGVKITDVAEPSWRFGLQRLTEAEWAMQKDALATAKKVRQPVETSADIQSSFDAQLTYFKGHALLGMLEAWMTPESLQHTLRTYAKAHAFGSATSEDLFAALDAEKQGAGVAMRSFVEQPGVPLVRVACQAQTSGATLDVSQRRYAPSGVTLPEETWTMPVCVRFPAPSGGGLARGCTTLEADGRHGTIAVGGPRCPAWVVGQADGAGYYRFAYTKDALAAILAPASGVSPSERIATLYDAAALVTSGDLLLGDVLALAAPAAGASDRNLAQAGAEAFSLLPDAALSDDESVRRAHLIRATYGARGAALGLQRRPNEGPDRELLRAPVVRALALGGRDPALRAHAHDLALAWLSDPKAIDPDLVEVLLTAAAKSNDGKLFDGLLQRAHAEKDHRKLGVLMQALGAFTDPALVRRAQEVVMGTALDLRETWQIFYQEFADRSTRELAWSFLQTSFDVLAARMREDEVGFELVSLTEQFCDDEHADAVQAFLGPRAARYDGVPLTLANAIDSIRQCAANYRRNRASLDAFLARY